MNRYYSTQRPVTPGSFPRQDGAENIVNFDEPTYCNEIHREAWGYIEYQQPITTEQAADYELIPAQEGVCWYPVTVSSKKHGGGLRVTFGKPVWAAERPADVTGETKWKQYKVRYFGTEEEAQCVADVIRSLDITTERVRMSATQGECRVYINGRYILNFGDTIELPEKDADPDEYYGDNIGGWRSSSPDSAFVLGLIWHPFDYVYHYSDQVCKALGMTREDWIEGNYWADREDRIWKTTEN